MASSKGKNAGTRRTAGSGTKKTANNNRRKTSSSRSTGSRTGKNTDLRKAAQEEQRAMEVRRDIGLLVFVALMVFVFIAELGYGGVVGAFISNFMFGTFGLCAYGIPILIVFLVFFIMSNMGRRTLPQRVTGLLGLVVCAETAIELVGGEAAAAKAFSVAEIYKRCGASKSGGGVIGGSIAYGLYHALRGVGAAIVVILAAMIFLLLLAQWSPVSAVRRARDGRIRRGEPSLAQRRRERAQERKREDAEIRELALEEKEREEKEREELLALERERSKTEVTRSGSRRAQSDPSNLMGSLLRSAADEEEEEEDFGLDEDASLFRRSNAGKTRVRTASQPSAAGRYSGSMEPERAGQTADQTAVPVQSEQTARSEGDLFTMTADPEEKPAAASQRSTTDTKSLFESMHISIMPTKQGKNTQEPLPEDEEERILRPDANTVRVVSPGLVMNDEDQFYDAAQIDRKATMKVFASSMLESESDDDLRFPFREGEAEADLRMVYEDSAGGAGVDETPFYDIADAGGMSTFRAQTAAGSAAAGAAAGAAGGVAAGAAAGAAEGFASGRAAGPAQGAGKDAVIDESALSGIEVHRDRGEEGSARASATAVSGKERSKKKRKYTYPHYGLLERGKGGNPDETDRELKETAYRLQDTLRTFGVNVTITDISKGPSITRYELLPEQGVKVSKIVSLADDIKLSLAAMDIRIEAPIPGKRAIGIEVPNKTPSVVALRDIMETREFRNAKSKLSFAVGKDLSGKTVVTDIAKMPHMLIAGATGSGKSVCINTIIMSILFKASPQEVQLIMIDPKVVELNIYNGIPHLMIPVVTDARKASAALGWATAEMDRRYKLFASSGVRDLNGYNEMVRRKGSAAAEDEKELPRIVVIVDELADLMMVAKNDVEASICRLAQLARAAGIHLIIATQRPSVDVITGLIKANMPSRLAFAVTSQVDSRTILDMAGAEKLIGKGDMLFYPQSYPKPARLQGAFVSDEEVQNVVDFIKSNNAADSAAARNIESEIENMSSPSGASGNVQGDTGYDEHFVEAGRFVIEKNKASIGNLQRVFKIGFNRAARIMDQLAEAGVVSEENGTKARQVLMSMPEFEEFIQGMS